MKKKITLTICVCLLLIGAYIIFLYKPYGKVVDNSGIKTSIVSKDSLANQASVNCVEKGGRLDIVKNESGSEYGICYLAGGAQCEEWAFYRGECTAVESAAYIKASIEVAQGWIKNNSDKYLKGGFNLEHKSTLALSQLYSYKLLFLYQARNVDIKDYNVEVIVSKGKIEKVTTDKVVEYNGELIDNNDYLGRLFELAKKAEFKNIKGEILGQVKVALANQKTYYRINIDLPIATSSDYRVWGMKTENEFFSIGYLKYSPEKKIYSLDFASPDNKTAFNKILILKELDKNKPLSGEKVANAEFTFGENFQVEVK